MKISNTKKQGWMVWSFLVFTLSLSIACNKKSDDQPPISPYGVGQFGAGVCTNCNFAQAQLGAAQSRGSSSFPVTINWTLIGDQNMVNQTLAQGMNPQKNYTGPLALQGAMNLSQSVQAGNCVIPAGQYQLSSVQAGTMSYGSINIPQLVAVVGGAQIVFSLQGAVVIDANGDGQIDAIAGLLRPMQGPGYNGYGYSGAYPGYPGYPGYPNQNPGVVGGMVSCNDVGVYLSQ
ncbi:MAG: hypothetical protein AABY64_08470 [Bdellovibrionota bacterium]